MSATFGTLDPLLKRLYTAAIVDRFFKMPDFTTPEWRAWADQWREEVPLTREQERENAEWCERVKKAREDLAQLHANYLENVAGIEGTYGVRAVLTGEDGDGEYDVDDYCPPHRPTYRTKDGAPPEPQMMREVKFVVNAKRNDPMT